ncbi:MAG: hypothetical protein ACJ735_03510 [Actinomycetes bacterium]
MASVRQGRRARAWPPPGGPYRDERLAFFAARDELRRRSRGRTRIRRLVHLLWDLWDWSYKPGGSIDHRLVLACNEAAGKFDALEREKLRLTGALPSWFFDEVHRLARKRRRRWR